VKKPNFVVIEKNKYYFFEGNNFVVSVESSNMTKEYLEYYRKNPEKIFEDVLEEE
jgi:hypothetical protein